MKPRWNEFFYRCFDGSSERVGKGPVTIGIKRRHQVFADLVDYETERDGTQIRRKIPFPAFGISVCNPVSYATAAVRGIVDKHPSAPIQGAMGRIRA